MAGVARQIGCTPSQVALSWLRQRPGTVVPILGARTRGQLADNLGCLSVSLSEDQRHRLDRDSRIDLGFPTAFLSDPYMDQLVYAGTFGSIDLPARVHPPLAHEDRQRGRE